MPIERAAPVALFLFAHQDDEFGVFHTIADCRRRGWRVACAYLTTAAEPALAARRDAESRRVLARLGVAAADIAFAGAALGIVDAGLPPQLPRAARWIGQWFDRHAGIELVCVTAWEGGHHDHDALHAAALAAAARRGLLPRLRQYALYHAHRRPAPLFRVLAPLAANGAVERAPLAWPERLRYLGLCLGYPSQFKTWLGLFPFVLLHYLWRGEQTLQPVAPARLGQRPHAGPLYYEQRRFYTWENMQADLLALDASGRHDGAPT